MLAKSCSVRAIKLTPNKLKHLYPPSLKNNLGIEFPYSLCVNEELKDPMYFRAVHVGNIEGETAQLRVFLDAHYTLVRTNRCSIESEEYYAWMQTI